MSPVYAFDLETLRLATDVEREFAAKLGGASPWTRPDLFGFGVGCLVNVGTGVVVPVAPGEENARTMAQLLARADATIGYNTAAFDLGVLSAYADVLPIRERHVDLGVLVMAALDALPIDHRGAGRIRQGGLDGLARANGFSGKTGHATDVSALLRAGRIEEVLDYCEADTRLVADLFRRARRDGKLAVDGYLKKGSERIELGRLEVAVEVPHGDLASGTCERCDDGMPADELVKHGGETVCQPCAEEAEDRRNSS